MEWESRYGHYHYIVNFPLWLTCALVFSAAIFPDYSRQRRVPVSSTIRSEICPPPNPHPCPLPAGKGENFRGRKKKKITKESRERNKSSLLILASLSRLKSEFHVELNFEKQISNHPSISFSLTAFSCAQGVKSCKLRITEPPGLGIEPATFLRPLRAVVHLTDAACRTEPRQRQRTWIFFFF